ncbi:MAG TPA: cobalamin-independent methionine synthase II family protein [Solirubrobacteraceae bacterium]|nr:cobalamin-independent methionine synthase II family protein [Solirubrobacteraceae bacterium]
MNTTYRTHVVGSLLRPAYLTQARAQLDAGAISPAEFKRVEDRAVDQAIALQEGLGIDVITDGEMRRFTFFDQLLTAVTGISDVPAPPVQFFADDPSENIVFQSPESVTGEVTRRRMLTVEEFSYARARARVPLKVTLPSPLMLYAVWSPEHTRAVYPDPFELFRVGAELIREEVVELARLGCERVQIDAPEITVLVDEEQKAHWEQLGISTARVMTEGYELIDSITDVPGVHFGLHLCRGNFESRWAGQGGYEAMSRELFNRCKGFDEYLLEYDSPRAGSFDALADAPDDKLVVLGLVSTKQDELEDRATIVSRIEDAASRLPRDQLALSTQCGFASVATGNNISEHGQEAKLRLVAEVASQVWG